MSHHCHADGCQKEVPPKMFMCLKHWRMVPKTFQNDIWKHYRPGQEIDKNPTNDYVKATQRARAIVRLREAGFTIDEVIKGLMDMGVEYKP